MGRIFPLQSLPFEPDVRIHPARSRPDGKIRGIFLRKSRGRGGRSSSGAPDGLARRRQDEIFLQKSAESRHRASGGTPPSAAWLACARLGRKNPVLVAIGARFFQRDPYRARDCWQTRRRAEGKVPNAVPPVPRRGRLSYPWQRVVLCRLGLTLMGSRHRKPTPVHHPVEDPGDFDYPEQRPPVL